MTTVHMICGKVGTGKSTYSINLAKDRKALLLSLDEWIIELYEHPATREIFDDYVSRCSELMVRMAERLVRLDVEVVLDFGFWKRAVRDAVRRRIELMGGKPLLHFLDLSAEERWNRLATRNIDPGEHIYVISREEFDEFEGKFEPPTDEENPLRIYI